MKKLFASILVLSLMAGLCACACSGPSDEKTKAVRTISFEEKELTVTLGTNKSTGYEWDYEIYGKSIEPSVNRSFKATGSKGDATGEVSIGFEGQSEGEAVIVLTTPNGWDGTGEGDAYTVNVEVAADGKIVNASGSEGAAPPKTSVTIDELADGTYTGKMSGRDYSNNQGAVTTTISPADITVTIEKGQVTLYCEAKSTSIGNPSVIETPRSPEYSKIVSGTLPLTQSGDAVTAEGALPALGQNANLYYNPDTMVFTNWDLTECPSDQTYTCAVNIVMTDGVPVATVSVGVDTKRTATVPLALK